MSAGFKSTEGCAHNATHYNEMGGVAFRHCQDCGKTHTLWQFADHTFGLIEVPEYGSETWNRVKKEQSHADLAEDVSEVQADTGEQPVSPGPKPRRWKASLVPVVSQFEQPEAPSHGKSEKGEEPTMSSKAKQLGTALENRAVNRAREKGLKAKRQPLSGVLKDYPHDVVIEYGTSDGPDKRAELLVECKVRSASISPSGRKTLRLSMEWLRYVQDSATKAGFAQGIVIVNEKGSQRPFVMVDLDFFLDLILNSERFAIDKEN